MSLRQDFSKLKETFAGRREASQREADWRQNARTFAFRATTAGLGLAALFFFAAKASLTRLDRRQRGLPKEQGCDL
jgi:hypothetical protein